MTANSAEWKTRFFCWFWEVLLSFFFGSFDNRRWDGALLKLGWGNPTGKPTDNPTVATWTRGELNRKSTWSVRSVQDLRRLGKTWEDLCVWTGIDEQSRTNFKITKFRRKKQLITIYTNQNFFFAALAPAHKLSYSSRFLEKSQLLGLDDEKSRWWVLFEFTTSLSLRLFRLLFSFYYWKFTSSAPRSIPRSLYSSPSVELISPLKILRASAFTISAQSWKHTVWHTIELK